MALILGDCAVLVDCYDLPRLDVTDELSTYGIERAALA